MREQYISYQGCMDFFYEAQNKCPDFIKVDIIGKTWEERDIILVSISNDVKNSDTKPALLYTGTIHAREWIGIELAVAFAKYLIEYKEYEPRIQDIFSNTVMYMVPCLNPDGFEFSRKHFSFWRKNRRVNIDGSFGVDLNRNFSIGFKPNNTPSSNVYPGPFPFSEPETKAIKDFVDVHPNISIALDYHSQGNVFFPAHTFRHEDTIDTTDINILCANMAEEIKKVSGREYGIHQGKPPASLISGSGREYYYSKGAIATVVEVGTQNISDYLENMTEHINEHIPALISALKSTRNYSKDNPLKRVSDFQIKDIKSDEVTLSWSYDLSTNIYFEVYRSKSDKAHCKKSNLVAIIQAFEFTDKNLDSATEYYYKVRAVDKKSKFKSPYAQQIRLRTLVDRDEFSKILFASQNETGYLGEKMTDNKSHFGVNSLFVGINRQRGISVGLITFPLKTVPKNAIIQSGKISLYPINRVSATIEKFGEWNVGFVNKEQIDSIYDFDSVYNADIIQYVGRPTKSQHLTQGIWRHWGFSNHECKLLEKNLNDEKVLFRFDGPNELKPTRDSQVMQWDLGYGKFGYGLGYRPKLELVYTLPRHKVTLKPYRVATIKKSETINDELSVGFDKDGSKIYGFIEFDLNSLPNFDTTIITEAFASIELERDSAKGDIRIHMEFLETIEKLTYQNIKSRNIIENVDHESSIDDIKKEGNHSFMFEKYLIQNLERMWQDGKKATLLVVATTSKNILKNQSVKFTNNKKDITPTLDISYIAKRRNPPPAVKNLNYKIDGGMLKLMWDNPNDDSFNGVIVVKNPFRIPKSPYDGQKLYGGKDSYTYDNFGSLDVSKYYAVFAYDDVPNYAEGVILKYEGS